MTQRICVSILILLLVAVGSLPLIDEAAARRQKTLLNRSLVTFGIAKTLNGAISVMQGTEVAATPAGVGVSLSLGEILDPLNDLVERFSWVMLASAASLAVQQILAEVGGGVAMKAALAAAAVFFLGVLWSGRSRSPLLGPLALRVLLVTVVLRLAMPVVVLANELVYTHFLNDAYTRSTAGLEVTRQSVDDLSRELTAGSQEGSFWQGLKEGYRQFESAVDLRRHLDELQEKLRQATEYVVDLIAVFLLQSVLLPLTVLWGLFRMVRLAVRLPVRPQA